MCLEYQTRKFLLNSAGDGEPESHEQRDIYKAVIPSDSSMQDGLLSLFLGIASGDTGSKL